jgi:DHA3 family tetracycline resistance protein-like MFS transporter
MPLVDRLRRLRIFEPLAERDYRYLTIGSTISLVGDGFFYVALAWQVYELSNMPTALSLVGLAWTLPLVLFVVIGGVASDRYDRRRVMIAADLARALAVGLIGILSVLGVLELWHVVALIAFVGIGDAFFNPASTAIVPDLLAEERLPQANALNGALRPLTLRLIGPALAGFIVAAVGPGWAFVADGASFLASALAIGMIVSRRHVVERATSGVRQTVTEIGEGFAFVRANAWCWATLLAAMMSLLVFFGPVEVLLPFIVKNGLGLGPEALGAIFAVGGIGSVVTAVAVGQLGLPRRWITVMYAAWSIGVALMAVYGLMTELWHALVASLVIHGLFEIGQITWTTMLQQLVPRGLLGRVSSLDWMVSTGLVPISFALTGPIADAIGVRVTRVGAALLGGVLMGVLLFVPGVRDPEQRGMRQLAPGGELLAAAGEQ